LKVKLKIKAHSAVYTQILYKKHAWDEKLEKNFKMVLIEDDLSSLTEEEILKTSKNFLDNLFCQLDGLLQDDIDFKEENIELLSYSDEKIISGFLYFTASLDKKYIISWYKSEIWDHLEEKDPKKWFQSFWNGFVDELYLDNILSHYDEKQFGKFLFHNAE